MKKRIKLEVENVLIRDGIYSQFINNINKFFRIKGVYLFISFLFLSISIEAQVVKGQIVDQDNNPVDYAVVVVQSIDSTYIDSAYSDSLGYFAIEKHKDKFILSVQHIMYELYQETHISEDIDVIKLHEKEQMLSEITIYGERPLLSVSNGIMRYDMQHILKNKLATNAYEALLELPGVYERDDKINLVGTNQVAVIINGRATTMDQEQLNIFLKNVPKDRILKAEVMYSAPPQYHIKGAAINITLSEGASEQSRLQGQANNEYIQSHYSNYRSGLSLFYNTSNTSSELMYSLNYAHIRKGESILSNHLYNNIIHSIEQDNIGYSRTPTHNIYFGNNWNISQNKKLSLAYTTQIQPWSRTLAQSYGSFFNSTNIKEAEKPIQLHNLDLAYASSSGFKMGLIYTYYYNRKKQSYEEESTNGESFEARALQNIHKIVAYTDKTISFDNDLDLSYGAKYSLATDKSSQTYSSLLTSGMPSSSDSESKISEHSYNVYSGISKELSDRVSLQASLTLEYYKHKQLVQWNIFPNIVATYLPSSSGIVQLSVSSNKYYPTYWEMQNAISYINKYTQIHGNTDLKPSNEYSIQLNYIMKQKYIFGLYMNYIKDNFNQLPYQKLDELILIYKTQNFDYKNTFGFNVIIPFRLLSKIDSKLILNGYYDNAKSLNFYDTSFNVDNVALYSSLENTINISSKPDIKFQLSASYITKNIQGPLQISNLYRIDSGVKWKINNNSDLVIKINDALNSWVPKDLTMKYDNQDIKMRMIPDSRHLSVSFVYKFGGYKESKNEKLDISRFGVK